MTASVQSPSKYVSPDKLSRAVSMEVPNGLTIALDFGGDASGSANVPDPVAVTWALAQIPPDEHDPGAKKRVLDENGVTIDTPDGAEASLTVYVMVAQKVCWWVEQMGKSFGPTA